MKTIYRKLIFHNVLARQGSSYCNDLCNRARLNFQAFALRDITMVGKFRGGQKMSYRFRFLYLNSACTRGSIYSNV